MAKRVCITTLLCASCILHVTSHRDPPASSTEIADSDHQHAYAAVNAPGLSGFDTQPPDHGHSSKERSILSASERSQPQPPTQMLNVNGQFPNTSTNETSSPSWHAHKHLDEIFNTTARLEKVALGESEYFIEKIFRKYSQRHRLLLGGLQRLMDNLGLGSEHGGESESMEGESGHNADDARTGGIRVKRRSTESVTHIHSDHSECYNVSQLLSAFHFERLNGLGLDHFLLLCPALIDQLDNSGCHHHHGYGEKEHEDTHDTDNDGHRSHADGDEDDLHVTETAANDDANNGGDIPELVWVYSSVAVLIISLVGLLGVAVIPVMRRLLYRHLLQFLVALAVGALCGDALLHLLPHALSSGHEKHEDQRSVHSHAVVDDHDHNNTISDVDHQQDRREKTADHDESSVWKGLVALSGLLFFFLAERVLTILTSWRAERRLQRKARLKADLLESNPVPKPQDLVPMVAVTQTITDSSLDAPIRETAILDDDVDNDDNINSTFLSDSNGRHRASSRSEPLHEDEGHSQGQGHGHSHHSGDVPDSVSAVAWMVILGDGIHNLSDGVAIGAAFASSITGGFSTAVAVFCHELPHEIGDFAMLLKAGMTAKQALLYNVLSSVLCFLGMIIGVQLGRLDNASSWVFCAVAGMFLYISLADMLPQLTVSRTRGGPSPCSQLLLQCVGVGTGAGIMLTIAIFEHDLKTIIE